MKATRTPTIVERFTAGCAPTQSGCLVWTKSRTPKGYGRMGINNVVVLAHRLAWELTNGPIPDGLCVLHRCDNPPCCKVEHLFLGTIADNNRDMFSKGRSKSQTKTECVQGHPYDAANTYLLHGKRICKACRRAGHHARRRRRLLAEQLKAADANT